jgi:hypothetical protein
MAEADITAHEPLSKKSLMHSGCVIESPDILFTPQNYQLIRSTRRIAHSHTVLRTQIHAWHIDDVKRLLGMLFVKAFNGLLQLCQRAQIRIALQLLLAFAAGKNEQALPRRRVGFDVVLHPVRLDADFL